MSETISLENGGHLNITKNGNQIQLTVSKEMDSSGLYKAWLRGPGGEYLLGTLSPEQGHLTLTKTVSLDTLSREGCWPISGGRIAMAFQFSTATHSCNPEPVWRWEHRPGHQLSDPILRESASNWGSMLIRYTENGFQLAAPFDPHYPFPITPLFCLGTIQTIDGQPHITFSFDQHGSPFPVYSDGITSIT